MSRHNVFISYSWDDEEHKRWVATLATDLRNDGVETRLDQWHTELGDPLPAFMAKEIRDNDFVLVVCTPNYRRKSEEGRGGVGYEGSIMTAEVAARGSHRKYIPVLARGSWDEAAPSWVEGKRYVDLSTETKYERNYRDLMETLRGERAEAPPVRSLAGSAEATLGAGSEANAEGGQEEERGSSKPRMTQGARRLKPHGGERGRATWHGTKATAAYTVIGVAVAALALLYASGFLRQVGQGEPQEHGKAGDLGKEAPSGELDEVAPLEAGTVFVDCDGCPAMVVVPAGRFTMGSPARETGRYGNEGPMRPVAVREPFAVGVYEVTRGQYRRFVTESGYVVAGGCSVRDGRNGEWRLSTSHGWRDVGFDQTDSHPVACVSWNDARAYVGWLSEESGERYRLPSESEWEYMARGGSGFARYWEKEGLRPSQCRFANAADANTGFSWRARCDDGYEYTAPVGSFEPNAFGVHDVLGNVWEWAQDCWYDDYSDGPNGNRAREREGCSLRVLRGGSRYVAPEGIRSAHRFKHDQSVRNQNTGFRVARSLLAAR